MLPISSTLTVQPSFSHQPRNNSRPCLSRSVRVRRLQPPFGVRADLGHLHQRVPEPLPVDAHVRQVGHSQLRQREDAGNAIMNLTKRSNAAILGFGAYCEEAPNRDASWTSRSPSRASARATSGRSSRRRKSVFAERGFGGATMAAIAARAGVPKPNVHYYFPTKAALYRAVIERVLTAWLDAARSFDASDDPAEALTAYIGAKMDLAREMPLARRSGRARSCAARPSIQDFLDTTLTQWVRSREAVVRRWIAEGKLQADRAEVPLLYDLGDDPALRQRGARDRHAGRRRGADDEAFERAKRQVVETMLCGVAARSAGAERWATEARISPDSATPRIVGMVWTLENRYPQLVRKTWHADRNHADGCRARRVASGSSGGGR